MPDDACSAVKADLEAGTFTNYTTKIPIYIIGNDIFEGGKTYITLKNPTREPVQTVNGTILYTKRSCQITIVAPSQAIRDAIYDDLEAILPATSRGYVLKSAKDDHFNPELNGLPLQVNFIL